MKKMDKLKEPIIVLAAIATIVACITGFILGVPPALVAIRQLQVEFSARTSATPPTVDSSTSIAQTSTETLPTDTVQPLPTVIVLPTSTVRAPTALRATATPIPPTVKPTPASSSCAQGNLTGRVESEIPGTKSCVGVSVSSVIDQKTKPRDVYALDLVAGQQVLFKIAASNGCNYFNLYNPSSKSIDANQVSLAFNANCYDGATQLFTPAASGTYYLVIFASGSGQPYTLSLSAIK